MVRIECTLTTMILVEQNPQSTTARSIILSPALLVLEPEPVGVPQPLELLLDDLGEEGAGTVHRLQHSAHVEVDLVQGFVQHREVAEQLGVGLVQRRIDLA